LRSKVDSWLGNVKSRENRDPSISGPEDAMDGHRETTLARRQWFARDKIIVFRFEGGT